MKTYCTWIDSGGPAPRARHPTPTVTNAFAAFKRCEWEAAVQLYSAALEADASLLAARNNRAQALLHLQRWQEAGADAEAVLAAQPDNVKALLRRAAAAQALSQHSAARADLERVLVLEPGHREAALRLASLT